MTHRFAEITITDSVKAVQNRYRTRAQNARYEQLGGRNDVLGEQDNEMGNSTGSFGNTRK